MKYSEAENFGNSYRAEYRKSISEFIAKLREDRRTESVKNAKRFANNGNEERAALSRAIGLSFLENYSGEIQAKYEKITECNGIIIYRVTLNVLTDIRYYGLLFIHDSDKKRPFVICQHGSDGTPELCSSLFERGSSNYNDMTMRVLSLGVNVFAPLIKNSRKKGWSM